MGSGMPEIGSRISLISKADIRYEGKLFSVDPDECTIALSSVRSYGTEDRKTTYPVPAQHQVYDFILFRGSDIKDIRVLTTTIPNDPAIVQLSVPPSLSSIENQFEAPDGDFRAVTVAGTSGRIPSAPSSAARTSQTFQNSGFKSASSVFGNLDQVLKHQTAAAAVSEDGSRSSTPSAHTAKGAEAPARTSISSNKSDEQPAQRRQPYGNRDAANRSQPAQYQNRYQNQQQQPANRTQYQQPRYQNRFPQQQQQQQQRYPQQGQYRDYNNRDYGNNREYNGREQYGGRDQQYRNYGNDYRGDGYGQRQYAQPLRNNVQRGDNWVNYQQQRRQNRPPGQGAQSGYQSAGGYQNRRPPRNTLKFDEEYDFEQANSQFEEVRLQMSKVKLEEPDAGLAKVNGDADKKEDSGNEVSGGEETEQEAGDGGKEQCYDKVKSFFDTISYEAIERSKGLTARLDWKTERKINSETFGQVALRRNLNNYRRRMNGGANGGNGYYQNYQQQNRNQGMQQNYRMGGYNNRLQGNRPRRQYSAGDNEESKENQVAA